MPDPRIDEARREKNEWKRRALEAERNIGPLVEAARNAVKELDYAPPGESGRDQSVRIKSKWWLEGALAPFEEETSS